MTVTEFLHMDHDEKMQEIDNILNSKEKEYQDKRKELRLFKTRMVLMVGFIFLVASGINWIYMRLPGAKVEFLINLYTEENSLRMTQLMLASKISMVIAVLLFFSKLIYMVLLLLKTLVMTLIHIGKAIYHGGMDLSRRTKESSSIQQQKSSESTSIFGSNDEEHSLSHKDKERMKQLMKEQLELGLSKYGLLDIEEAPKKGIEILEVIKGPTISRYWVQPNDILIKDINNKVDDIALAMGVQSVGIRMDGGKLYFEVPNLPEAREVVYYRHVYDEFIKKDRHPLEIPMGMTATGELLIIAINTCPHMLIAGRTGAGKSVCANVILSTISLNASPEEVKLLLIDPKRVELSMYEGLPHLMRPIAKSIDEIKSALAFILKEMESRYVLLETAKVRDIEAYHAKGYELPYVVVVFDEVAAVMKQAPVMVEDLVSRLSGEARAAGIHLILGTQRPSVDVITGVIKANLPTAIAFATKSNTDSRVILDAVGAEKLLGKGDGLLMLPDRADFTRFQGAFLKDEEVEYIIEGVKEQYGASTNLPAWECEENQKNTEQEAPTMSDIKVSKKTDNKNVEIEGSEDEVKKEDHELKQFEGSNVFEDVEEIVDAQLLSYICKEKIKGESVLPPTSEIVELLKRRKSVILESINHLIDKGHIVREGGGKYQKINILISRDDAIRYLFNNDISSYEEVQNLIFRDA